MRRSLFDLRSHQSGSDIRLQALACFLFIELLQFPKHLTQALGIFCNSAFTVAIAASAPSFSFPAARSPVSNSSTV